MIPKALEAASSETMGGLGNWRTFKRFVAVFSTSEEQDTVTRCEVSPSSQSDPSPFHLQGCPKLSDYTVLSPFATMN